MSDSQAAEVGQKYLELEEVERKLKTVSEQMRGYAAACECAAFVLGIGGGWDTRRARLILKGEPQPQQGQPISRRNPSALQFQISETQDIDFPSREEVIEALESQRDLLAKKRTLDAFFASRKT